MYLLLLLLPVVLFPLLLLLLPIGYLPTLRMFASVSEETFSLAKLYTAITYTEFSATI
jgi:hypothetical protein